MSKTSLYSLLIMVSPALLAEEQIPETIEILAPKQQLVLSANNQSSEYYDDRYTHNLNRTIADKLNTLSGVNLNGQGGQFQSYSIRGFSRGRIRTEVDGIPIITDRRAGNSISFIASDLFSDINVIKGPSSTFYGSQALGGVVSLSTETNEQRSVKVEGQSGSAYKGVTVKHLKGNLSLGLAQQSANNQQTPDGEPLNTQFNRVSGLFRYQHQNKGLTTTVSWLPSVGKDIGKSNAKHLSSEISQYPEEQHSLAQVQVNSGQDWLLKIFHHYQNWDSETLRIEQYKALTQYQSHTLGGQWLGLYQLNDSQSFIGLDWLSRKGVSIDSSYELLQTVAVLTPELMTNELIGEEDNLAIYNKTNWQLGNTQLTLSLRYDWLKQQNKALTEITEQTLSASFTTHFVLSDSINLGFELANGFRYPTLSERFFNGSTPRGFIAGNANLKPETSLAAQTSVNWQLNDVIEIRSAFYHYDLNNYIERYRSNDDLLSHRNLPQAKVYGVEVEASWYVSDNIEHRFIFQQQNGRDHEQQRLDDLLPKKLNWSMLASFDNLSVTQAVTHYFDADQVGPSESKREHYTLWDMSLSYQLSPYQEISLVLNNLTNRNYFASLDEDAPLQPKRSVKLALIWQF